MFHKTVALMVLGGLFGASVVSAQTASVKKKDGSVVKGDIVGQVVVAQAEPRMAVAYGKDIASIDESGVHLKSGAAVVEAGMPAKTDPAVAKNAKRADILKIVVPITAKMIVAQRVDETLRSVVEDTGRGDGNGVGTAPMTGGGRVYFFKQVMTEMPLYPIVGELQQEAGVFTIQSAIRVNTASGIVSIPVDQLVVMKGVKK